MALQTDSVEYESGFRTLEKFHAYLPGPEKQGIVQNYLQLYQKTLEPIEKQLERVDPKRRKLQHPGSAKPRRSTHLAIDFVICVISFLW